MKFRCLAIFCIFICIGIHADKISFALSNNGNLSGCAIRTGIFDIEFSPDGKYVAATMQPGIVKLWDRETGVLIHTYGQLGDYWIGSIEFSQDGEYILLAEWDTATLWSVVTG